MNSQYIVNAFDSACDGYSVDRVVADPEMNAVFLDICARSGVEVTAADLNRKLMNLRKCGALAGRPRSRRTHFPDEDEYRFAAEMAVRFMERKHSTSLDGVICDPTLAAEFDTVADNICPGYTALQYRWAALGLRKSHNLKPELVGRLIAPEKVCQHNVVELLLDKIPRRQGLYLFFDAETLLYIGETENLYKRLKKHLEHSDNKGLARWLWTHGTDDMVVEIQVLPDVVSRVRKALELELIRSRKPIFNVQR